MNRLVIVGFLIISTAPPLVAEAQPDPAKLKADAQKVVSIISGDKAKAQTYCQIGIVGEQINQALQVNSPRYSGPRFFSNSGKSLGEANLPPKDGQEIVSMFDTLDKSCPN